MQKLHKSEGDINISPRRDQWQKENIDAKNQALLEEDARYIGLDKVAHVIKTGSTFAGTDISKSTKQFQKIYHDADIVISKGQGNFETLEEEGRDILFILKVKCDVVARHANLELGSLLFAFNNTLKAGRVNPT